MCCHANLRVLVLSAAFRELDDVTSQITFFRDSGLELSYETISLLLDIPKTTTIRWEKKARKVKSGDDIEEPSSAVFSGPHALLTLAEEQGILTWIAQRQESGDCPSPKEVRWRAADIRKMRVDDERLPKRGWWSSFKGRYGDMIGVKIGNSRDSDRCQVSSEEVKAYYKDVKDALRRIMTPAQMLNMDESGLSGRPNKGKRKKIVFCKDSGKIPTFREERDVSHVSIVSTISLEGESLKPMFLTVTGVKNRTPEERLIRKRYEVFKTPKGYQTAESMAHYVTTILTPYCQKVREELADPNATIFLIMDNYDSHKTPLLLKMYQDLNVRVIWLPPHSSHFLQMLDVTLFANLKRQYAELRRKETKPKVVGKLLRLAEAWHRCTFHEAIRNSWTTLGFRDSKKVPGGTVFQWSIHKDTVLRLIQENCPRDH
jgi:hypothetical protein